MLTNHSILSVSAAHITTSELHGHGWKCHSEVKKLYDGTCVYYHYLIIFTFYLLDM
jgi:hypothetical protein